MSCHDFSLMVHQTLCWDQS